MNGAVYVNPRETNIVLETIQFVHVKLTIQLVLTAMTGQKFYFSFRQSIFLFTLESGTGHAGPGVAISSQTHRMSAAGPHARASTPLRSPRSALVMPVSGIYDVQLTVRSGDYKRVKAPFWTRKLHRILSGVVCTSLFHVLVFQTGPCKSYFIANWTY